MFNFDFCYGGLRYHPANFDLKLCKLPTSERRACSDDSDRDDLSAHPTVCPDPYLCAWLLH